MSYACDFGAQFDALLGAAEQWIDLWAPHALSRDDTAVSYRGQLLGLKRPLGNPRNRAVHAGAAPIDVMSALEESTSILQRYAPSPRLSATLENGADPTLENEATGSCCLSLPCLGF